MVTEGHIFIGDTEVTKISASDRDVSMVFQSYALFPHMTVMQNVSYGLTMSRLSKQEVKEKSQTGHTVNLEKPWKRIVEAAGLDPKEVVRHTLRHTAITHLVQAGVDLPTVKRISGHKTLTMVERYSHQNGEHIQAAMDKLEQRYEASNQ